MRNLFVVMKERGRVDLKVDQSPHHPSPLEERLW